MAANRNQMTFLPGIPELGVAVFDRGVPNLERIVITPTTPVDMALYILTLGVRHPGTEMFHLMNDRLFWFGSGTVTPNDRLFIYTGPGEARRSFVTGAPNLNAFVLHWGSQKTLLADVSVSPLLLRVEAMNIGSPLQMDLPQLGAIPTRRKTGLDPGS